MIQVIKQNGSSDINMINSIPAGTNNIGDVDILSSALPSGAATELKQDAIITWIDGLETLLTAIKDTAGIKKITDALPAGTNILGKVGIDQTTPGVTNAVSVTGSLAKSVYAVTPSDTVDLAQGATVGIYVGGSGDVVCITSGGTTITFTALSSGMIHPIAATRIKATGTTATGILAVY